MPDGSELQTAGAATVKTTGDKGSANTRSRQQFFMINFLLVVHLLEHLKAFVCN